MALRLLAPLILSLSTGCYFFYPSIPNKPRPEVVQGESVQLLSEDNEYMASCDPTRERRCGLTSKGEFKTKRSYVTVHAEYAGRTLDQFELRKLVDPDFEKKLARVHSNKGTCNVALVPSVVSVIGLAVLTFASPFYEKLGDKALYVGFGAAGAAAGGALLSYPLGGFACRRARKQYKEMFAGVSPDDTTFILRRSYDEDEKGSDVYVDEMVKLTEAFNAQFGGGRAQDGEPTDPPPSDPAE